MINNVNFKGKKYPYRVGYLALKKVKGKLGREFDMSDDNMDYEALEWLIFYAIETGCKQTGQNFDLTFEDIELLVDESFQDLIKGITDFSQAVGIQSGAKQAKKE